CATVLQYIRTGGGTQLQCLVARREECLLKDGANRSSMKGDGRVQQNRSPRLPSWAWIIIVPLVSWLALFVVLIFAGMVPLGAFGFLSGASSESTPIPDQSVHVLK